MHSARNLVRGAALTALCLALSGCFISEEALITADQAERPLSPGAYRAVEYDEGGGGAEEVWTGQFAYQDMAMRAADNAGDFPLEGALLRSIGRGTYAMMGPKEDDAHIYAILFTYADGSAGYFSPLCEDLSAAGRARIGLSLDGDNGTCLVESWPDLREALRAHLRENEGEITLGGALFPIR